ncbi:response regulator [Kriegella aquimaris]|uniref:Response regulator receiver domain-containing protein n=1 Tax=Kriegella aquimaris TaxID=192904 RepID=A0A1G9JAR9_9FLAO|nr:response regulator [Kriegella aquimaris]SDL34306.1 Response regulator receiver domain-containing protein [Kriegella aquimaris]
MEENEELLIYMAEDDEDDQKIFTDAISAIDKNSNVTLFNNGDELITILKSTNKLPNIIFLDLLMPKKNGEECLIEIRDNAKFKNVPIVVYSNVYDIEKISSLFEMGANRYLHKPYSFDILMKALDRTINSIRSNSLGGTAIINYAD